MKKADIYKKDSRLVIEVPLEAKRSNPWDKDYHPRMDNITGLVVSEIDFGFCYLIDMDYAGKDDQYTDFFYKSFGSLEDFEKICKKIGVGIIYEHILPKHKPKKGKE